jgi:hypothetical protein
MIFIKGPCHRIFYLRIFFINSPCYTGIYKYGLEFVIFGFEMINFENSVGNDTNVTEMILS